MTNALPEMRDLSAPRGSSPVAFPLCLKLLGTRRRRGNAVPKDSATALHVAIRPRRVSSYSFMTISVLAVRGLSRLSKQLVSRNLHDLGAIKELLHGTQECKIRLRGARRRLAFLQPLAKLT
jgi:hypothetical protein